MPVRFRILPAPEELRAVWAAGAGGPGGAGAGGVAGAGVGVAGAGVGVGVGVAGGGVAGSPSPLPPSSSHLAEGPSDERVFEIASELDEIRIGRQPAAEIELPFPSVSSFHARLFRGDLPADWWVEDLGSTNGTWVDGTRLSPRSATRLRAGQRLRIATVDIVFEGWSATPRGAETTATLARRLISDLFGVVGGEVPTLAIESGVGRPSALRLAVRDRRYLAGRADGCDLVFPGEHVSREHAAFVRGWDGVVVSDLGSKNGVLVNGRPIPGETKLADGDRIEVGVIALRFTDPEDRYLRRMESLEAAAGVVPARVRPPIVTPRSAPIAAGLTMEPKAVVAFAPELARHASPPSAWVLSGMVAAVVIGAIVGLVALLIGTR